MAAVELGVVSLRCRHFPTFKSAALPRPHVVGGTTLHIASVTGITFSPNQTARTMINVSAIDDIARRLAELVPTDARAARDDLAANFRDALRSGLRKLDLVTREEFDVQRGVLLRTREKIEALEAQVAALEAMSVHSQL